MVAVPANARSDRSERRKSSLSKGTIPRSAAKRIPPSSFRTPIPPCALTNDFMRIAGEDAEWWAPNATDGKQHANQKSKLNSSYLDLRTLANVE
jgi:hypothetical protein